MLNANLGRLKIGLAAMLLLGCAAIGCQQQQADALVTGQAARNIMLENVEIYNTGNMELIEQVIAPNYVGHYSSMEGPAVGRDGLRDWVDLNRGAYSDFKVTVDQIITEGNMVCMQWTVTGTNDGPLRDLPPTGKPIRVTGLTMARIADGKIVEEWITWNMLEVNRQLGYTMVAPEM
ncbi:MAG: ester cyclase [Candidatus Zixiibacteriota bacterium]|nr:MAG: ester cyclase [candidate division Zixibacteria bacterium]